MRNKAKKAICSCIRRYGLKKLEKPVLESINSHFVEKVVKKRC